MNEEIAGEIVERLKKEKSGNNLSDFFRGFYNCSMGVLLVPYCLPVIPPLVKYVKKGIRMKYPRYSLGSIGEYLGCSAGFGLTMAEIELFSRLYDRFGVGFFCH